MWWRITVAAAIISAMVVKDYWTATQEGRLPPIASIVRAVPSMIHSARTHRFKLPRTRTKGFELFNAPRAFEPQADDIVVAAPDKHGGTWLLHMMHQLRMRGAPEDFDDQSDVIPWLEASPEALGHDLNAAQAASPRLFKSHLPWGNPRLPTNLKRVFCFRDLADVAHSAWKYIPPMSGTEGLPFADFTTQAMLSNKFHVTALQSLAAVWQNRTQPGVALFFFDDLLADHEGAVRRLAHFMGLTEHNTKESTPPHPRIVRGQTVM